MDDLEAYDPSLAQPLTPRELEILTCISEGLTNPQIAKRLFIALSTVKWHVRQIHNKLGVSKRRDAVAAAQSMGLLPRRDDEEKIRHNLPTEMTPFVGRKEELAALAKLVADPHIAIITIIGPGGIGKTRLALEAAKRELSQTSISPDGIFFISLAPLNSAVEIVPTLAAVMGFQLQDAATRARSEMQQILDFLRQKQMLLIMDNFEHLMDGLPLLSEISRWAPKITFLITSRERLQLHREQLFPLQGLELPQGDDLRRGEIIEYACSRLFLNISRRNSPDFKLLPGEEDLLLRICRLVEGMPLGLELAASWTGLLPMSIIAEEIEQSLDLLRSEYLDIPERHRSMQATLDVSWKRLSAKQKLGFQGVSIFRGGISRPAALEVAGASLPLLVTLVNKSWLSYDREKDRYSVHELLRQYGANKLSTDPAHEQEVQKKHSAYFCRLLKERERDLMGTMKQETISEMRQEIDNIQISWRWAVEQRDVVLLSQGLNSLCRFYLWEVRMTDGLNACRSARERVSKLMAEPLIEDVPILVLLSQILAWESEFVDEIAQKEILLTKSQHMLDRVPKTVYDARLDQAYVFLRQAKALRFRNYEQAIKFANLGLKLFRELNDRQGEAETLVVLGSEHLYLGAYDRANELLLDGLEIKRQLRDKEGIARIKFSLGLIARHQGQFDEAEALHMQSLELYRQQGDRRGEAKCSATLSYTYSFSGKFSAAKEAAEKAVDMDKNLGQYPNTASINPHILAIIHLGHYCEAKIMAAKSLETARERDLLMDQSWGFLYLGMVALVEEEFATAKHYLQESIVGLMELKHIYHSLLMAILSYVARAQGDSQLATDILADALQSGIGNRSISPILYCLPAAALLIADKGQTARAIEMVGLAQRFGQIKNSHWFKDIAFRELDEVCDSIAPEIAAAAVVRGRDLELWSTAAAIQHELAGL